MRHARAIGIAGLVVIAVGAVAFAQSTVQPLPDAPAVETRDLDDNAVAELTKTTHGDPQKGAQLAGACAACHGLDGNADADPSLYPRIAGQSERYIAHQLALFKSGERNTGQAALMMPMAMPLSAQDMRDIGAYYATQKAGAGLADDAPIAAGPNAGKKFYQVGEQLFRAGDTARGIPSCMACHGPAGAGNPGPAYPHVAGQEANYVVRRLQEYRAGNLVFSDPHNYNIMASVAKQLTDEEINSLGSYLQGLHERPDAATLAAMAKLPKTAAPAPAAAAPAAPAAAPMSAPAAAPAAAPAPAPAAPAPAPAAAPPAQG